MPEWLQLAVYLVGWLIACRVLARYVDDIFIEGGLFGLGVIALFWPFMVVAALFWLPVWLVTRGVRPRGR